MSISVIISYCTNDYRFLSKAVDSVSCFANKIIIPVSDHFFNGEKENRSLLEFSYREHPDCHFVEFSFDEDHPYGLYAPVEKGDPDWIHFWHSTSRYIGYHFVPKETDYVLFIDVDEIFDEIRFTQWLSIFPYQQYSALKFSSYFYFRSAAYRAHSMHSNGPLMVKKDLIKPEALLDVCERKGIFVDFPGLKIDHVCGLDDKPLCHHYSWVKPSQELFRKVVSWGHHQDKNWKSLLEEEFRAPFRGKDSLFGLTYETVEPIWDPLSVEIPKIDFFRNSLYLKKLKIFTQIYWQILREYLSIWSKNLTVKIPKRLVLAKNWGFERSLISNLTKVDPSAIRRLNVDLIFGDEIFKS